MTAFGAIDSAVEAMRRGAFIHHQALRARRAPALVERACRERALPGERPPPATREQIHPRVRRSAESWSCASSEPSSRRSPMPPRRCSSRARPAPARSWSPAPSTTAARAPTGPSSPSTARRLPEHLARERALRPRARRLHGRRQSRRGLFVEARRRDHLPRRDRRLPLPLQGKLLARLQRGGPRRRQRADPQRRRALRRRHAQGSLRRSSDSGLFREDLFFGWTFCGSRSPLRDRARTFTSWSTTS